MLKAHSRSDSGSKVQRRIKDTLPAERQQRLEALGFVWDALESAWEEGFAALATFKDTRGSLSRAEGSCRSSVEVGTVGR